MNNVIDVGEVHKQVKEYFNFDKVFILGIHSEDGSYIASLDKSINDMEILSMIQTLKDVRVKRTKNE